MNIYILYTYSPIDLFHLPVVDMHASFKHSLLIVDVDVSMWMDGYVCIVFTLVYKSKNATIVCSESLPRLLCE